MHDKLECGCKANVKASIDMLVLVQATRARRWNNQELGQVAQAMKEQLREDEQELKTREQKMMAKDAKSIRGIVTENDKNKGTSHVQDEWRISCTTTSRHCSACGRGVIGMSEKHCCGFLTETYVEFNQESMTEQRFSKDVDYDDAAIGEMLFNAYREQVYHSQREGLSVGQSSSVSERTGRPVGERTGRPVEPSGQDLNVANAQIRTLLDRQKERTLAECQAEIKKHEFQAGND